MGCGNGNDAPAPVPRPVSEAAVGDQAVVARVGEDVIRVAQVEQYVATHGVSPREALRALEDDALLLQEARRRGWQTADVSAQARAEEQLLAQRVLLDIEREHPLDGPTEAEVEAYLREHLGEIVREEQRDCVQVLVQVPPGATEEQERLAQAYVERTLERMRAEGVSAVWSSQPPEYQGLRVLSQYLPPASPSTDMPDEFRRACSGSPPRERRQSRCTPPTGGMPWPSRPSTRPSPPIRQERARWPASGWSPCAGARR
jgi:hypothetical protein